jgi:hypothetical protein
MAAFIEDPALWITWYDLASETRDEYLQWLHGRHMPSLVTRPGVSWAAHYAAQEQPVHTAKRNGRARRHPPPDAVPQGHRFILLVGGEGAQAFSDPTPKALEASLGAGDREMLAMRQDASTNVMIEHLRIDGPESRAGAPGEALSPCIQLGSFVFGGDEQDLIGWYAQWRLPSMTTLSSCVGVRKLVSLAGWAKHAILHEFTSAEAREAHFVNHEQKNHPEKAAWSERITGQVIHGPGSPSVAIRLCSVTRRGTVLDRAGHGRSVV